MNKYSAEKFYELAESINELTIRFKQISSVDSSHIPGFAQYFDEIRQKCHVIGLEQSRKQASRARDLMVFGKSPEEIAELIKHHLRSISELIKSEMESSLFFHVPFEKAKYYKPVEPLFGKDVHDNFPSAEFDIREAGNCFAFGRQLACVFHLSRVVEALLGAIDKDLGIIDRNTTWNYYITGLHSKMLVKYPEPKDQHHTKMRAFYLAMENRLREAKDVWRDDATHDASKRFTDEEAEDLIQAVRLLMRHAAEHLNETP